MASEIVILIMLGTFLLLAFTGTPVGFALIAASVVGALFIDVSLAGVVRQLTDGIRSPALFAVPFFLLAAELMNSTGISDRIFRFVQALVGHVRSSLAQVDILFSVVFAGLSGSALADVAANAKVLLPPLEREGYDPAKSAAMIATSSTVAQLIPPTIMGIVYGAAAGVSIAALFLGSLVAGLVLSLSLMIYVYCFGHEGELKPRASLQELTNSSASAILPLLAPLIIMGGILSGVFTATESGVIAVSYILFIVMPAISRGSFRHLFRDIGNAAIAYSLPLLAVAGAFSFSWLFTFLGGSDLIADWMRGIVGDNSLVILAVVALVLIGVGQFLDPMPAIILFVPIVTELATLGDVHPIHMGVIVGTCLCMGLITPPYGLSLVMASEYAGVRFIDGIKASIPLYGIYVGVIGLIIVFPDIVLFLPRMLAPEGMV